MNKETVWNNIIQKMFKNKKTTTINSIDGIGIDRLFELSKQGKLFINNEAIIPKDNPLAALKQLIFNMLYIPQIAEFTDKGLKLIKKWFINE